MRFYTHTMLSEHIAETPEGFLVCHGVPIARIGVMEYGPEQVPVEPAEGESVIRIERSAKEVFDELAMASFEGKPLTIDHPREDVTPANWKELAVGHAQDVRRGAGEASDLLLADIVVTDEKAIALVRGGLREVSCGYDAIYEQTAPGRGCQTKIRGNHIALVHRGRCGPRCRINDNREDTMSKEKKKLSFADRMLNVFKHPEVRKALDEAEEAAPAEAAPETPEPAKDEEGDRVAALEAKLGELLIEVRRLAGKVEADGQAATDEDQPAQPDAPDKDKPAEPARDTASRDKALAATVDADTRSRAEAMVPGMRVTDSDKRCAVQRVALRAATRDSAAVAKVVNGTLRGSTLDDCDCVTLDAAFLAASEVTSVQRNAATADGLVRASVRDFGKTVTPADINAKNREFHKGGK